MSDTLDMLFFGDLAPHEQETVNAVEIRMAKRDLDTYGKKLRDTFTPEQTKLFEAYLDHQADLIACLESAAFKKGFCLGMQLTIEGMGLDKKDI